MYSVTESYLTAVRGRKRTDRITGSIVLAGGTEIAIDDTVLVKDTLKISRELCSGRYRIGTFCLSKLRFSFFLADALGIDLAGAYADLTYGIKTGNDTYENVPLGRFCIDPVLSTRRKDIVSIVGFDAGVKFDREPSASVRALNVTAPELIAAVCAECGVPTDIAAGSLSGMPNSTLAVNAAEKQIQSCRDIVMWCAALMCGYAVIGRDGKLCIIPAKYEVEPEDPTVIVVDRNIREDERERISVTDTRAYIRYLTAYVGSDVVNYTSTQEPADEQASPASYTMEKNPLMSGLSEAQCDQANRDWLTYIQLFQQRGVEAQIFGDPALDTGDTIMFRGGDVDQRAGIAGVITGIDWSYRGYTSIKCLAAQCCGSLENGGGAQSAGLPQVRTQTHKRIDSAIASGGGTGKFLDSGKTSVSHNDREHNTSQGIYDSVDGYKNTITGAGEIYVDTLTHGGNTVTGEHNTLTNCTDMIVSGKFNDIRYGEQSVVSGNSNIYYQLKNAIALGYSSFVQYIWTSILMGKIYGGEVNDQRVPAGTFQGCLVCGDTFIFAPNKMMNYSVYAGTGHHITDSEASSAVFGNSNTLGLLSRSIVTGGLNNVSGDYQNVFGEGHSVSGEYKTVCGKYGVTTGSDGLMFIVGGGTYDSRQNVFTIDNSGNVRAAGSLTPNGADYAEYFEWADGNPDNEDRSGMLVTLDGDRIIPAHGNDFIGAVSVNPSVVGNNAEMHWHGKYKTDVFGQVICGSDGKPIISGEYKKQKYVPRSERQEWGLVGLVGRLVITDDGSCKPGGYVSARRGTGTSCYCRTNARVLRRIDETHIEVLIR